MLSQNTIMSLAKKYKLPMEKVCEIADVCEKYGIKPTGDVFRRTPEDIEKMVQTSKIAKIDPEQYRTMFSQTPAVVQEIVDICMENKIKIEPSVFRVNPKKFRESIEYIKSNYGERYVKLHIAMRDVEKLKVSMPLFNTLGLLPYTLIDASVFDLTRDQIVERTAVLLYSGVPLHKVTRYNQVDRINRAYTLSESAWDDLCYCELCVHEKTRQYQKERFEEKLHRHEAKQKMIEAMRAAK